MYLFVDLINHLTLIFTKTKLRKHVAAGPEETN